MKPSSWTPILLGSWLLWAQQSPASVIVEQPFTGTINGFDSSLVRGQQIADDFVMPVTAQIQSLQWDGVGINGDLSGVTNEAFQIRFYADTPTAPLDGRSLDHSPELLPFFTSNVTATPVYTGISTNDGRQLDLYSFAADIPTVLLDNATTYWLSILGDDQTEFLWTEGGPGAFVFRPGDQPDGSAWFEGAPETYVVFALSGVANPIPEPPSLSTLGIALALTALSLCAVRHMKERTGNNAVE